MTLKITVLGSGSSGNAILLTSGSDGILIDAGFSRKVILSKLQELSIPPKTIKAIFITHEHSDHTKGLRVTADYLDIPAYLTYETAKYLNTRKELSKKKVIFDAGTPFNFLDFKIHPFRVAHDAIDPVGFIISTGKIKIGIALDLGHMSSLVKCRLKGCNALILESNYDTELLKISNRPLNLKRRIAGRLGHLSNDEALSSLHELFTADTKHLLLGHISSECNDHSLLQKKAISKLDALKRTDIHLSILKQHTTTTPISIE
jgi:phosphoribosyl 1,2-cyclic phosphodiesterase